MVDHYMEIEALDTLFFRDGKPFAMGEESFGAAVFPPAPSVFMGFLRSVYFGGLDGDISRANSTNPAMPDPTAGLSIIHIALRLENDTLLYPIPADLIIDKEDETNLTDYLNIMEIPSLCSSSSKTWLLTSTNNKKLKDTTGKIYITAKQLQQYQQGKVLGNGIDISDFMTPETKVGIGRDDNTRTSSESGRLYQVQMQRLEGIWTKGKKPGKLKVVIGYNGLEMLGTKGISKLGGEGKMICYSHDDRLTDVALSERSNVAEMIAADGQAKMYLATPAVFKEGWRPYELAWNMEELLKDKIEITAACVGRYKSFGGWDMVERKPKAMYRAVPAGSVYYLKEKEEGALKKLVMKFHGKPLEGNSIPDGYSKQGFGIAYFARIQGSPANLKL